MIIYYVMKGTSLKSINFNPSLEDASDEDIELLYLFLLANPTILSMKVLERQTFDVECLSTMDETIEVQTVWKIIYWSNYTSRKCFAIDIIINWFIFILIFIFLRYIGRLLIYLYIWCILFIICIVIDNRTYLYGPF